MADNISSKKDFNSLEVRKLQPATWFAFIPFIYILVFFVLGTVLFWSEAAKEGGNDWSKFVLSSLLYITVGGFGFILVTFYTIYRLVKHQALILAIQRHWPLLFAILYFFIPNLPGPVDEIVVSTILGSLATYLGLKDKSQKQFRRFKS